MQCLWFVNLVLIPHTYTPPNIHCPCSRPVTAVTAIKNTNITSNYIHIMQAVTIKQILHLHTHCHSVLSWDYAPLGTWHCCHVVTNDSVNTHGAQAPIIKNK
jgi:hypothetical protein